MIYEQKVTALNALKRNICGVFLAMSVLTHLTSEYGYQGIVPTDLYSLPMYSAYWFIFTYNKVRWNKLIHAGVNKAISCKRSDGSHNAVYSFIVDDILLLDFMNGMHTTKK